MLSCGISCNGGKNWAAFCILYWTFMPLISVNDVNGSSTRACERVLLTLPHHHHHQSFIIIIISFDRDKVNRRFLRRITIYYVIYYWRRCWYTFVAGARGPNTALRTGTIQCTGGTKSCATELHLITRDCHIRFVCAFSYRFDSQYM